MLRPWKLEFSHEELFIERYDRLINWALQLTENRRDQAEDLVHDAFVQFTFTRPGLHAINNLDGYLYGILRNLRLLQMRRSTRSPLRPLSIVEYDSAEIGIRALGLQAQLRVQDELRMVCQYVCQRKESSKVANALILRFFHGYFTGEIAQVMKISRRAVNERLRVARAEAKVFRESPDSLGFLKTASPARVEQPGVVRTMDELLRELRRTIFQSRTGNCLTKERLCEVYGASLSEALENVYLAHLVSCRKCLDEVNRLLGLPLLNERYPTDMLGPDNGSKGPGGARFGGGGSREAVSKCLQRASEVFDHRPQELCISVNGDIYIWHKINAGLFEQTISLNDTESVDIVEIFSEQDIGLMFLAPERPQVGPVSQSARIELSDQRSLEVSIDHGGLCPVLNISYRDPTFEATEPAIEDGVENVGLVRQADSCGAGLARWVRDFRSRASDIRIFQRPGTVTAVVAVLLIATVWFLQFQPSPVTRVSVVDLLARAGDLEQATAARTDHVIHRTINFEATSSKGTSIERRKIEIWQSAELGVTARRLYDANGQLLAGEWRRRDGVQTLYHHGAQPQLRLAPDRRNYVPLDLDTAWQLDLSARDFSSLIGRAERAQVTDRGDAYAIAYEVDELVAIRARSRLIKATLTLSRADLHAIDLRLRVAAPADNDLQWAEFHFTEAVFERRARDAVAPAVFDPEVELLDPAKPHPEKSVETENRNAPVAPVPAVATTALELEVLRLVSAAGADVEEQISVTRTPEGRISVEGLVETNARKTELLLALHPVGNNPAVQIRIKTVAEELSQQRTPARLSNVPLTQEATTPDSIPAYAELRRYFANRGGPDNEVEQNVRRFATRMTSVSYGTVQRAMALKRLAGRFSADDLRAMDRGTRTEWRAMVANQARKLQAEVAALHRELNGVFPAAALPPEDASDIASDAELIKLADRLFELCSVYDRSIHKTLTLSADTSGGAAFESPQFWRGLQNAERLAGKIAQAKY